jgi:hypothetical protein
LSRQPAILTNYERPKPQQFRRPIRVARDRFTAGQSSGQRQALAQKALERKLDVDAKAVEADNRHRASSVDMANTIHQVRALEDSTKSDYTVRAEYETASGRTNVEIKKSNNTVIIVIAIVIAIIVLITFSK